MHIAEVVTIAKSLPLLRLNTYKSLILSYSADYRRIFLKNTTVKVAEKAIFPGEYLVELKEDTLNSRYYMELLLDEEFPDGFDKNDACLIVDDDLYWVNDPVTVQDMEDLLNSDKMYEEMNRRIEYLFETGQIGAGNIPFIDSLGQHGGYVIEVVGKPVDRP